MASNRHKIPDEEIKEAYDYYLTHNVGIRKAAEHFNMSFNTLRRYMNRNKLNDSVKHKKELFDENFFNILDTEKKAYWFGMLYTDGNVTYNLETYEYRLTFSLRERDKELIEKFARDIGIKDVDKVIEIRETSFSTNPDKKYKSAGIRVSSKKMMQDLMKYGCVPDKTHNGKLNMDVLSNLPNNLKIAFLRGFLDGDGYFHYKNWHVYFSIYRKEIAEQIQQLILETFNIKTKLTFQENKVFISDDGQNGSYIVSIQYREDAKKFLRGIYKGASIYLNAKYQSYLALEEALR